MTSLSEVYGSNAEGPGLRRLYLGTGLLLVGGVLSLLAILFATTGILETVGVGFYEARKAAGLLGGVGVPATLMGVFTVLPTNNRIKAAAVIGAAVCGLGVSLFWHAYPVYWVGSNAARDLTLHVAVVYSFGLFTTVWCLFTAVVNFKTRNDPGGTARVDVAAKGETKVVEVPTENEERSSSSFGGVAFLGADPDGNVETQTGDGSGTASDGGTAVSDLSSPLDVTDDAEVLTDRPTPTTDPSSADSYCGNCRHFDYKRAENSIRPYCGLHDAVMDDVEACDEWTPNNSR